VSWTDEDSKSSMEVFECNVYTCGHLYRNRGCFFFYHGAGSCTGVQAYRKKAVLKLSSCIAKKMGPSVGTPEVLKKCQWH
jgi:hypothetical protein